MGHTQKIMNYQHLSVSISATADADGRDGKFFGYQLGKLGGDFFKDYGETPQFLQ